MTLSSKSRWFLRIGACAFFGAYLVFCVGLLVFIVFAATQILAAHSFKTQTPSVSFPMYFTWVGAFIALGYTYMGLSFAVHCPKCGAPLLRVPSGLEPLRVNAQNQAPALLRLSRWSNQGWSILRYGRIQCIRCNHEYTVA